jgi:hypothetical protein
MDFNLKIYTLIEPDIIYVHVFFLKFSETLKLEVLEFEKRKRKPGYMWPGLHLMFSHLMLLLMLLCRFI